MEFVDQRLKLKKCSTCNEELGIRSFARNRSSKDGYRSNCKTCARVSKQIWYQENRDVTIQRKNTRQKTIRRELDKLKCDPCVDCGKSFHPSLMDWDHVRGEKNSNVSDMIRHYQDIPKVIEEIAKCDLVCCLCHRIRTWNRLHVDEQIQSPWF